MPTRRQGINELLFGAHCSGRRNVELPVAGSEAKALETLLVMTN